MKWMFLAMVKWRGATVFGNDDGSEYSIRLKDRLLRLHFFEGGSVQRDFVYGSEPYPMSKPISGNWSICTNPPTSIGYGAISVQGWRSTSGSMSFLDWLGLWSWIRGGNEPD